MILMRTLEPSPLANRFFLAIVLTAILFATGCADMRGRLARSLPLHGTPDDAIERNDFVVAGDGDVIGRLATMGLERGDTLPDIARHFSLGINDISAANPGVDMWVPGARERILLPLNFILPDTRRNGIVINLATMRLFYYHKNGNRLAVSTYPVGVGTEERPTPMGEMVITRKKHRPTWYVPASIAADHRKKGDPLPSEVPPGPLNPLGEYALYLSEPSYLIHGTNKPASIGLRATNGCIRLYPEDIERLFEKAPVKTAVLIVNQPYLVGRRDGVVYLEANMPFQESGTANWKTAYAKLKRFETQSGIQLDWKKVKAVVIEARGIPVPVSVDRGGAVTAAAQPVRLRHPGRLVGQPEIPAFDTDAWYVLAASLRDRTDARRLAAIINHQGPPIPARVLSEGDRHRVLAGPFDSRRAARDAARRLKIDLELDAVPFES
ncbi:transpeptidase [Desulfosarcina alkanivorans]|uniref:Transpeptidase n=2 Tax=Desulfosarcina alkanivorans TaxID=571177 RepID=A0A5K7YER0_9BACT|nr:transpeptidase [Desulfosarcina alkanivorans]